MNNHQHALLAVNDLVEKIILLRSMDGYNDASEIVLLTNLFTGMKMQLIRQQNKQPLIAAMATKWFFDQADLKLVEKTGVGLKTLIYSHTP